LRPEWLARDVVAWERFSTPKNQGRKGDADTASYDGAWHGVAAITGAKGMDVSQQQADRTEERRRRDRDTLAT